MKFVVPQLIFHSSLYICFYNERTACSVYTVLELDVPGSGGLCVCLSVQGVVNLDVLGTCHSESEKAAVLQPVHLHRYQLHVERGLSFDPPEVCSPAVFTD